MANWLKSRSGKYTGYVVIYTLVIVAVLAAINFLANRYVKSYDSTSNKQFSLSDQSVKLVKGLKNDVRLTYFGDNASWPGAKDLLDQYAKLSPKVHTQYIDPVRKRQDAKTAGYRSDSPVLVTVGDKQQGAKALTEEEITGALMRAQRTGERNVYFLSAGGEGSIEDTGGTGFSYAKQLVERDNYKTQTLAPKGAAPEEGKLAVGQAAATTNFEIPKDCTVLVVAGPQTDYPAAVVNAIKTYVEGGGRALIMLDDPLKIGRAQPPAENAELVKLISEWGVTVNKDLVLDLGGVGQIFGLGPEIPLILQYPSHAITSPLTRSPTAFPISRSLDVKSGDKTAIDKVIETTEDSVAVTDVGPGGQVDAKKGKKGPLAIAAAGKFTSGAPGGRFVVVGTSAWAENSMVGSRQLANADLFGNMVNWLSSDEDLISIRPKAAREQALNLTGQRLSTLFWLSVILFPLAVVGVGLSAWWKRR